MQRSHRAVPGLVAFCFFISGAAGLAYQLAWMRYLALFLGHTSYAVMAVLAAFMGGLAIGNALSGRIADRAAKPLALYAWLEAGIGLYALIFPAYYAACGAGYVELAKAWQPGTGGLFVLKLGFSLLLLLIPTIGMGATFPVMTRYVTRSLAELRGRVAWLYAINSAGAVAGCVIADFWWIPAFGLEFTVFGAACLNLLAALLSFAISLRTGERPAAIEEAAPAQTPAAVERYTPAELRWAVWGIGASGFVAMLYEIAWTRLLALAMGSSTHAFSIMLITFITGIAVGAAIISRWKNSGGSLRAFAWAELALAATVLASMFFYDSLPYWFVHLASLLARKPEAYPVYQALQAAICFSVMLLPTICLGLTLPLASRIATTAVEGAGRAVGRVFAINTLGTVLGTMVTALWLMPGLGLARTFAVGAGVNALIGLVILGRHRLGWRHALAAPAGLAVFVYLAGVIFTDRWQTTFALGFWRQNDFNLTQRQFREAAEAKSLKYVRDGAGATVTIASKMTGGVEELALTVNGKVDASTGDDRPTQLLCGHLPMLLHPNATQALVVGFGSGMTVDAVARHASLERVDVVEISPEVVEAARFFSGYTGNVHDHPKVHTAIDDAKSFLKTTDRTYDVIISEPSNPWMAGVAGVFTGEYYANCKDRLRPGGLMTQWVQTYETDDATFALVLRTFTTVFPHVSIWQPAGSDLLLIGSDRPAYPALRDFIRRFEEPGVRESLARIDIDRPVALLAREIISWPNGASFVHPAGPIHTDFFPELEYRAQRAFFVRRSASTWLRHDESLLTRPETLLGAHLREHGLAEEDFKSLATYYLSFLVPPPPRMASVLHRWRASFPQSTLPLEMSLKLGETATTAELEAERHRPRRDELMRLAATDPFPLRIFAGYLLGAHRAQRSVYYPPPQEELRAVLGRLIETDPANTPTYHLYLAELAWDRGDDEECLSLGGTILARASPEQIELNREAMLPVLSRLLRIHLARGQADEAMALVRFAVNHRFYEQNSVLAALCRRVEMEASLAATVQSRAAEAPQP